MEAEASVKEAIAGLVRPYLEHPDDELRLMDGNATLRGIRLVRDVLVAAAMDIEDHFTIEITDEELRGCVVIADLWALVLRHGGKED